MGTELTYYDFAVNDLQYLVASYEHGIYGNAMGANAQNICERFLKHIVDMYYEPTNDSEENRKTTVLHTHNLQLLLRFIKNTMNIAFDEETEIKMERINGYYFTSRYPGDDSFLLDRNDIEKAVQAAIACGNETERIIEELEEERHNILENTEQQKL